MDRVAVLLTSLLSSKLQSSFATSGGTHLLLLLRRLLLLLLHSLLRLLLLLLSPFPSRAAATEDGAASPAEHDAATRALSHVLVAVSRVAVASRKYEMVRGLADRLLDDNLRLGGGLGLDALNRAALSAAFARTIRRLEDAACPPPPGRPVDLVAGAVRAGLRRLGTAAAAAAVGEAEGDSAEKMAAEALWLAGKLAECGGAAEAVGRWGAAVGLGRAALAAEPRLQVALVRLTAFLFKHANAKVVDKRKGGEEEELKQERALAHRRLMMLTSWLPLLCWASNGTDSPILSSSERTEMVRVLEDTIEKLSRDEQEDVLALWLHHFTSCPSSDWPNLESCYIRWYAESRKLLLE